MHYKENSPKQMRRDLDLLSVLVAVVCHSVSLCRPRHIVPTQRVCVAWESWATPTAQKERLILLSANVPLQLEGKAHI